MSEEISRKISANPKFQTFVATRNRYSIVMTLLGAVAYYGFILLVAFNKEFLAQKVSVGATTSLGIPIGVGIIIFTIILTWIYVHRANTEFDATKEQIVLEAKQ